MIVRTCGRAARWRLASPLRASSEDFRKTYDACIRHLPYASKLAIIRDMDIRSRA